MPTPEQILSGLNEIANRWQLLAVVWHVYFAVLAIGLLAGIRPSKRLAGVLLSLPLFSVSALAWSTANPFNGMLFAVIGVAMMVIAARLPQEPIQHAPRWETGAGVLMFLFGWVYPHFLEMSSWLPYLYAAPTGLVPCPTLSIVIGLSLIVGGFESRAWSLVLGAAGLFYGLFGALRLGVVIDLILLLGALLTVFVGILPQDRRSEEALAS